MINYLREHNELKFDDKEERLKTLLYNAITLLVDETASQYDDKNEFYKMIYNELGTTKDELKEVGIVLN